MKGIARGYEQLHTLPQPKTEVRLPCSSCQEIFVQIPTSLTPETQYAEIQAMLKEKEPKCENCIEVIPNNLADEIAAKALEKALNTVFAEPSAFYHWLRSKDSGETNDT